MVLRILLGVACLSLLHASQAEAQLFRRFRAQPQPRYQPQPQQYAPQPAAPQNGFQGRLTASPRNRPVYVRRADGSVVLYSPNNTAQQQAQAQRARAQQAQVQRAQVRPNPVQRQVAAANSQRQPNIVTAQGQLVPVRPTLQPQRRPNSVYLQPAVPPTVAVAPVGVSVLNQPQTTQPPIQPPAAPVASSILPATAMPEAIVASPEPASSIPIDTAATNPEPASSIPVNTAATNPAPRGLSLSLDDDIVPASADIEVKPTPAADVILDSNGQKTFSVLETID